MPAPSSTPLADSLLRQFDCAHKFLREAITNFPADHWQTAYHPFFVPARLAFHLIQATDYHIDTSPDSFNWNRFHLNWEEAAPETLPDQPQTLAYLAEVETKLRARLQHLPNETLLGPDCTKFFPTTLDHLLYTLRHIHHHLGQLNAQLKTQNLKPARWR